MRRRLPWFLVSRGVAAKGRRDCGAHEFYTADGRVERCYHCDVGMRPCDPNHCEAQWLSRRLVRIETAWAS